MVFFFVKKLDKVKKAKNQKYTHKGHLVYYILIFTLMKPKIFKILYFSKETVILIKKIILSENLKENFRKTDKDFTRNRILTYDKMLILLLQKWVKSLQLRLNEFALKLDLMLSNSAFTQSRSKILPEVFDHLNLETIIKRFYDLKKNEAWYDTFWDFRILAIDWSKIRLPDEKDIQEKYWKIKNINMNKKESYYTGWILSVLHDALNNLALDYILEESKYPEIALAIRNIQNLSKLPKIENNDLIIMDRWYYSSFLISIFYAYNKDFLIRLKRKAIKEAEELFDKNCKIDSKTITLKVINKESEYSEKYWITIDKDLKEEVKIRLIRVILDNWDIEVLATSLLDEDKYKNEKFSELYFKRWWIEIYYDILKNRLWLENFSWLTVNSILQDLSSSIFLSNFETIITRSSNLELEEKINKKNIKKDKKEENKIINKQKVNKNVSFNIIKNTLIELFLKEDSIDKTMDKIMKLFKTNPTQIRPWRTSERKTTVYKALNYHKRKKKNCF